MNPNDRKDLRVCLAGHSPRVLNGFGRLIRELSSWLFRSGYGVDVLSFHDTGPPVNFKEYVLYPGQDDVQGRRGNSFGEFGRNCIPEFIRNAKGNQKLMIAMGDYFNFPVMKNAMRPLVDQPVTDPYVIDYFRVNQPEDIPVPKRKIRLPKKMKLAWYAAIDSYPLSDQVKVALEPADVVVSMAKHGYDWFSEAGIESTLIDCGVDTTRFRPYPFDMVRKLKEEFLSNSKDFRGFFKDKFVVTYIAQNQVRKMNTKAIESFVKFVNRYGADDAVLLLHSPPQAQSMGFDLHRCIERYDGDPKTHEYLDPEARPGMGKRIRITHFGTQPDEFMVDLMNVTDVNLYPSGGEGIGMPHIEMNACGTPGVATNFTSGPQFTDNGRCGLLIPVKEFFPHGFGGDFAIIDTDACADLLGKYYTDRDLLELHSVLAREQTKKHSWDIIGPRWIELVDRMMEMST